MLREAPLDPGFGGDIESAAGANIGEVIERLRGALRR